MSKKRYIFVKGTVVLIPGDPRLSLNMDGRIITNYHTRPWWKQLRNWYLAKKPWNEVWYE